MLIFLIGIEILTHINQTLSALWRGFFVDAITGGNTAK